MIQIEISKNQFSTCDAFRCFLDESYQKHHKIHNIFMKVSLQTICILHNKKYEATFQYLPDFNENKEFIMVLTFFMNYNLSSFKL